MPQPAPIPMERVEPCLAEFGKSLTLPGEAYTSQDVFEWEMSTFFSSGWSCLGRLEDIVAPGEVAGVAAAGKSFLVSRSPDGAAAVFFNVCRHRGHELVPIGERVPARMIRCPYHSWTYRLDGTLKTAPRMTQTEGFDPVDWPLRPVRFEVWRGWLFVDPGGTSIDLAEHIANLDELISPYAPEDLVGGAAHDYEIAANWKLIVENYHECYHCTTIHPALCKVSPPDSGADRQPTGLWVGGTMELMDHAVTMSFDGTSPLAPLPGVSGRLRREVLYSGLFPNLLISCHPDYVLTHLLTPVAPNLTRVRCEWLFAPEAAAASDFSAAFAVDFWDVTNAEDWGACQGVQRGAESGGYMQGPLSEWEASVFQVVRMVAKAYAGEGVQVAQIPDYALRASYRDELPQLDR